MTLDVYSHVNWAEEKVGEVAKVEQYASEKPKAPEPEPAAKSGKVLVFQRKVGSGSVTPSVTPAGRAWRVTI